MIKNKNIKNNIKDNTNNENNNKDKVIKVLTSIDKNLNNYTAVELYNYLNIKLSNEEVKELEVLKLELKGVNNELKELKEEFNNLNNLKHKIEVLENLNLNNEVNKLKSENKNLNEDLNKLTLKLNELEYKRKEITNKIKFISGVSNKELELHLKYVINLFKNSVIVRNNNISINFNIFKNVFKINTDNEAIMKIILKSKRITIKSNKLYIYL